jgi:hypothetical protein
MSDLSIEPLSVTPAGNRLRERAEAARARPAAYGPDLDLTTFGRPGERERVQSLRSLEKKMREAALLAGIGSPPPAS